MATFDGWDTPQNSLMHFRTKGSKNGVRRFQNEDGTWTPLGLRERKEREGWGDEGASRKERKAQRQLARAERHQARRQARAEAREAAAERRRKNSLKGLTDAELQQKINRLKMEQEYKELSKSPLLKVGETLVKTYFEAKEKQIAREEKKAQMENNRINAKANLAKAKAQQAEAKNEFISQITGASRKKAKAELKKVKNEERKNTVRGAISSSLGNVIRKEGSRFVKGMSEDSLLMRGGRRIKAARQRGADYVNTLAKDMAQDKAEERKRKYRSNNPFKG